MEMRIAKQDRTCICKRIIPAGSTYYVFRERANYMHEASHAGTMYPLRKLCLVCVDAMAKHPTISERDITNYPSGNQMKIVSLYIYIQYGRSCRGALVDDSNEIVYETRDYPFGYEANAYNNAQSWAYDNGYTIIEGDDNG